MSTIRTSYRVLRTILFSAIILVVVAYVSLYILISVPGIQRKIKDRVCDELTAYLGGEVSIGNLEIIPFNEVRLKDVSLRTPSGEECLHIGTVGAGIHLWRLLSEKKIEITYGEFLDLDARLWQNQPEEPLNIQFIIDAVSPKDKSKPPTLFDLTIHNIVIRRSKFSYDKRWIATPAPSGEFDPSHIAIKDLKADITLPRLKNNDFDVDVRRLAFLERSGLNVKSLSLKAAITDKSISCPGVSLTVGETILKTSEIYLSFPDFKSLPETLKEESHRLGLIGENVNPSDFKAFSSILAKFPGKYYLDLEVAGNIKSLQIEDLDIRDRNSNAALKLKGDISNLSRPQEMEGRLEAFKLELPADYAAHALKNIPGISDDITSVILKTGNIGIEMTGGIHLGEKNVSGIGRINTSIGNLIFDGEGSFKKNNSQLRAEVSTDQFDVNALLPATGLGIFSGRAEADMRFNGKIPDGHAEAEIDFLEFKGHLFRNISAYIDKENKDITANLNIDDAGIRVNADGNVVMDGASSALTLTADVGEVNLWTLGLGKPGTWGAGQITASLNGNSEDNVTGSIDLDNIKFSLPDKRLFSLRRTHLELSEIADQNGEYAGVSDHKILNRQFRLDSDLINLTGDGKFNIRTLTAGITGLLHTAFPSLIPHKKSGNKTQEDTYVNLVATIPSAEDGIARFRLPVKPLTDISLKASYESRGDILRADIDAPYLLQGTNKLITNSSVHLYCDTVTGSNLKLLTTIPVKHGRASLDVNFTGLDNHADGVIAWKTMQNDSGQGVIYLEGDIMKSMASNQIEADVNIRPSSFTLGPAEWHIGSSQLHYGAKELSVNGLKIWHDNQFVDIEGRASVSPQDSLSIDLAGIDLDYIFDLLNIEYVSFGGTATGRIMASGVFSKTPIAETDFLKVERISYNGAVLGDADIESEWNNEKKEIEIRADIRNPEGGGAKVDGGIYLTRDSLSFEMEANKVDIQFLKPFMAAFTSDVGGRASGKVKLFGTFKDIDLIGRAYADSISMKVDYTNVYYHGQDSIIMDPGMIRIPGFTLRDRNGHTALLSGYVKHSYFHNPEFEFRLTNARDLLCYDTNSKMNPDWYGTIYAGGGGTLRGRPGIVSIDMDVTTSPRSEFTFVLNETQTALDYNFLTFSDKKKEETLLEGEEHETIESKYLKKIEHKEDHPSIFAMDLRVTATPEAKMVLVMDPKAGDKIEARGGGPLQISYDTESDQMKMYGKYTLAEGDYNFSLQELILRDFKIKEGSSISFNGDPLQALLNIQAVYRVNTNLSDLDKSFSTDRDLNRTNVPVDALLNVTGNMQSPDITFDISLPTLTSDVERKVKSIISTDDMLSRQIIYLLALNKFYTPEYMSTSGSGGELASVASSTISSQLSNIMGQLTDKVTVSPSFRSDKGDFSDMEVDLSLSSRLLNNRLLINGNFGYRDRSTSQTTFVGDFDIEYLLNRNGGLRLKAYNHFNDQNYYLKSSLTTQGLGIIYRRDFDNPFTFLKRRKKKREEGDSIPREKAKLSNDSVK